MQAIREKEQDILLLSLTQSHFLHLQSNSAVGLLLKEREDEFKGTLESAVS